MGHCEKVVEVISQLKVSVSGIDRVRLVEVGGELGHEHQWADCWLVS